MKQILALLLFSFCNLVFADLPYEKNLLNFELGMTPEQVELQINKAYPTCKVNKLFYKDLGNGGLSKVIGQINIDFFNDDSCQSDSLSEVRDNVIVRFVHTDINDKQPAYEISIFRSYSEPKGEIKYSFDEVKKSLSQKYGPPAADSITKNDTLDMLTTTNSKGKRVRPKNTKFDAKFIWAEGVKDVEQFCFGLDCGRYYLKADMLIDKRNDLYPKNTFYVDSIHFQLLDTEFEKKQIRWVLGKEDAEKQKNLAF